MHFEQVQESRKATTSATDERPHKGNPLPERCPLSPNSRIQLVATWKEGVHKYTELPQISGMNMSRSVIANPQATRADIQGAFRKNVLAKCAEHASRTSVATSSSQQGSETCGKFKNAQYRRQPNSGKPAAHERGVCIETWKKHRHHCLVYHGPSLLDP